MIGVGRPRSHGVKPCSQHFSQPPVKEADIVITSRNNASTPFNAIKINHIWLSTFTEKEVSTYTNKHEYILIPNKANYTPLFSLSIFCSHHDFHGHTTITVVVYTRTLTRTKNISSHFLLSCGRDLQASLTSISKKCSLCCIIPQ